MPTEYRNYIDGEWIVSEFGSTFEVANPAAIDKAVGRFQDSKTEDAERAVKAAVSAQDAWASRPAPARGDILNDVAQRLADRKEEATKTLVREEGKTQSEASGEVQRAIDIFYYYAEKTRDLGGTVKSASAPDKELSTRQEPLGTVGIITPWNYPSAIPAWKIAPALAAGNTVVVKPASQAPNSSRILFECLDDAGLLDGAANLVTGSGSEVGTPMIEHDDIDGVSFTGSTTVGTKVAQTAADDLKRVQCEMGGKNPTVVMPSADIDEATKIVGAGAFGTTGQSCTAASRAIVHESVHNEFLDAIVEYAESLEIGPGLNDPDVGPHVSEGELESTLKYVEVGQDEGATLETGGDRLTNGIYSDGFYVEPTVFSDVDNDMRIAQEEIFGPVLSVIEVADFRTALEVANDVEFGLSASIVTQNLSEANAFVDDVEAGVAKINEKTTGLELHAPFGGYKRSSTNTYREQGDAALDFYTTTKTVRSCVAHC